MPQPIRISRNLIFVPQLDATHIVQLVVLGLTLIGTAIYWLAA